MIPITLEISLDGISGIKYGNAITIDYLLPRYKNNCLFQVTYITDRIDSKEWITHLNSQLRVGLNHGKLTTSLEDAAVSIEHIEVLNRNDLIDGATYETLIQTGNIEQY